MSDKHTYYAPTGGLPPQTQLISDRAIFTEAYAIIPKRVLTDIVISYLPFWENMRMWVIARPLSGFSETFSQYIVEVGANGGSEKPELDEKAEGVLFVVEGEMDVNIEGVNHHLETGGYAYLPPGCKWTLKNNSSANVKFHWIRKAYQFVEGIDAPEAFVTSDNEVEMPEFLLGLISRQLNLDDPESRDEENYGAYAISLKQRTTSSFLDLSKKNKLHGREAATPAKFR